MKQIIESTINLSKKYCENSIKFIKNIDNDHEFMKFTGFIQENLKKEFFEKTYSLNFENIFKLGVISYFPITEKREFTIAIFFIPKGLSIPLHDHPDMIVLSKVLEGEIKKMTIDYNDDKIQKDIPKKIYFDEMMQKEIKIKDKEYTITNIKKDEVTYLTPLKGNIHQFTALENSAIFDILFPAYDMKERFCNFYKIDKISFGNHADISYLLANDVEYECLNIKNLNY